MSWTSSAFGLNLTLDFPAPGLPEGSFVDGLPRTAVRLARPEAVGSGPGDGAGTRLLTECFADGPGERPPTGRLEAGVFEPDRTIDWVPGNGYRLYARGFGTAWLAEDGSEVRCAPPEDASGWSWQRFLVGRVLPWAAVLRGHEALHAGAVAFGGRAVGLLGESGWGKTSLVLQLLELGRAEFVTDDVLAVSLSGAAAAAAAAGAAAGATGPVGYPGAGLAAVRDAERDALGSVGLARLGRELGREGKTYLELPRRSAPVALGVLVLLRGGDGPLLEAVRVSATDLLAATFVRGVRTPERLVRQLDICAALAGLPAYVARPAQAGGSAELAEAILQVVSEGAA